MQTTGSYTNQDTDKGTIVSSETFDWRDISNKIHNIITPDYIREHAIARAKARRNRIK